MPANGAVRVHKLVLCARTKAADGWIIMTDRNRKQVSLDADIMPGIDPFLDGDPAVVHGFAIEGNAGLVESALRTVSDAGATGFVVITGRPPHQERR